MATGGTQGAAAVDDRAVKAAHREMWALGDYPKVSREVTREFGPRLVRACGIGPGMRVLDVGAGPGNVALRAAEASADVIASDLTPALLDAGRREAEARGLRLEWSEADAEALPFGDDEFDAVTSAVGAMFAPHHEVAAREMLRVCRPGGVIGMINWTPEGAIGEFFRTLGAYAPPPPPGASSPLLWGTEEHVREMFGDRVRSVETSRELVRSGPFDDPQAMCDFYKDNFGPVINVYRGLADDPARTAELDRDYLEFARRSNRGDPGEPARYELEYLLVVARREG
jgi:ubiquinone/menaquinone biosynthesis C-methylase UbiE